LHSCASTNYTPVLIPITQLSEVARLIGEMVIGYINGKGALTLAPAAHEQLQLGGDGQVVAIALRGVPDGSRSDDLDSAASELLLGSLG
jgi:hypothetical protein